MADTNKTPSEEYAASVTDGQLAESQAQAEVGGSTWKDLAGKAWDTMVFLGGKVKEAATWVWEKGKELVNKWLGKDVAEPTHDEPQDGQPVEPEDEPQDGEEPEEQDREEKPQGLYPWSDPDDKAPNPNAPDTAIKAWEERERKRREAWEKENGPYVEEAASQGMVSQAVVAGRDGPSAESLKKTQEALAAFGDIEGTGGSEKQFGE